MNKHLLTSVFLRARHVSPADPNCNLTYSFDKIFKIKKVSENKAMYILRGKMSETIFSGTFAKS